jgi:hypothetical protein
MMIRYWALTGLLMTAPLAAQQTEADEAPAAPPAELLEPPLPPKVLDSEAMIEPTVTITQGEDGQVVEEYAQNGTVYMVKVTPKNAPAYYLMDTDGDGDLESKWTETEPGIKPVHWKVKEWK